MCCYGNGSCLCLQQGIAMVMAMMGCVAAVYIMCITVDLLATERHIISRMNTDNDTSAFTKHSWLVSKKYIFPIKDCYWNFLLHVVMYKLKK